MELANKYNPAEVEDKNYRFWLENNFFRSVPDDREPYTVVIPPPNVTGVLHMGHMLNNTIQDILVRRARMQGKNACWVPGTDHASIATEAKVVAKLAEQGIDKKDLTREEFLNHAWNWTHKHGGIILEQLKKLGCSCDWERTCFTMDEVRSKSVINVFCDLYEKGLIYRGVRMVNWDPKALTAVSDEEVNHKEVNGKLFYLKYKIVDDLLEISEISEDKLIKIFNSYNFSNDSKIINIEYRKQSFGNFFIEFSFNNFLYRIINDRNELLVNKYDKNKKDNNSYLKIKIFICHIEFL
jgi:valyl-tRNA synthetase